MTTLDIGPTGLAGTIFESVNTRAVSDQGLVSDGGVRDSVDGWSKVIDQLLDWFRNPQELADEDFLPPSKQVIKRVCDFVVASQDGRLPSPLRVVPDGDGGISFEWHWGSHFQTINFDDDGSVELLQFEDCKLVRRLPLG